MAGDQPVIQWLVIPVRASFLKEFFEVQLIVQNLTTGFTFEHGAASLELPDGLSLAPVTGGQQATVDVDPIAGGSHKTVSWYVRGDVEGQYDLTASYVGSLEPIGKPIRLEARTLSPLRVWGGNALRMTVTVDRCAVRNGPYRIDVALENVTDSSPVDATAVYNVEVEMLDRPADAPDWQALYSILDATPQRVAEIAPGETFVASFTVFAALGNDDVTRLQLVPESSFIQRTGGNVTIPTELAVRDVGPCTQLSYGEVWTDPAQQSTGADTALVHWSEETPASQVAYYELLSASQLGGPLTTVAGAAQLAPSQRTFTLRSDRDLDVRYITVRTHLSDGNTVSEHLLGEGPPRYVALGDSFSAGEGLPPFEQFTDGGDGNTCHRSIGSYSRLLSQDITQRARLLPAHFAACSGATTSDFSESQAEFQDPQRNQVSDFTEVITLTIGGNDVGFAGLAAACAILDCAYKFAYDLGGAWLQATANACRDFNAATDPLSDMLSTAGRVNTAFGDAATSGALATMGPLDKARKICQLHAGINKLLSGEDGSQSTQLLDNGGLHNSMFVTLTDLVDRAHNADILVGGYPYAVTVGDSGPCEVNPFFPFDLVQNERTVLHDFTTRLDTTIEDTVLDVDSYRKALRGAGSVRYVDPTEAWQGHELCTGSSHNPQTGLNSLVIPDFTYYGNSGPVEYSFHPNVLGQRLYAEAFAAELVGSSVGATNLAQSQTAGITELEVAQGTKTVTAQTTWPGSDVVTTLVSPSGARFDRTTSDPRLTVQTLPTSELLELSAPEPGAWSVEVYGADISGTEPVRTTIWASDGEPSPIRGVVDRAVTGNEPLTVTFDATASTTSPPGPLNAMWHFGDGTSASGLTQSHVYTGAGPFQPSVELTDAAGNTQLLIVRAVGVGTSAVVAADDTMARPVSPAELDVTLNDASPDWNTTTISIVDPPEHGSAEVLASGAVRYTPNASGADSFRYRLDQGTTTSTATVVLVAGVAEPVARNDDYRARVGSALVVDAASGLLANDTILAGTRAVRLTTPSHGDLALADDGSFTYDPPATSTGTTSFTYAACDVADRCDGATVTIVIEQGATPTLPGPPRSVNAQASAHTASITWLAPDTDGGAPIISYTATAQPSGRSCTTTALGCGISGLAADTNYTVSVVANNAVGASPGSTPISIRTASEPPTTNPPSPDPADPDPTNPHPTNPSSPVPSLRPLPVPARLADTRAGGGTVDGVGAATGTVLAGSVLDVAVAGRAGVPLDAFSVVLNVTAVDAQGAGYMTVYPCGTPPNASNLNFGVGQTIPNSVIARLDARGHVCVYTSASAQVLVDIAGYFPTNDEGVP
jgi:hypothetical protein